MMILAEHHNWLVKLLKEHHHIQHVGLQWYKYESNHACSAPEIHISESRSMRMACHTVSNAFARSKNTTTLTQLLSIPWSHSSVTDKRAVLVERLVRKLCWRLFSSLCSNRNAYTWLCTSFSKILAMIGRFDIGRDLYNGVTFAVFHSYWNMPVERDRL